jgi:tartrate dehydrogenase/decarboxylase/D-malate dehydrogenase
VLEAAPRFGIELQLTPSTGPAATTTQAHGQMMPDDWKAQLQGMDALLFGAVGWPATVPDHVSLWGSLLKFRREFDQYINLRPVRLFEGVPCPLAGRKPGDIDYLVVRENTEGEYTNLGGIMYAGTEREIVIQESVYSRFGADRVLRSPSSWRRRASEALTWPPRATASPSACPGGTAAPTRWPDYRRSRWTSSTSTSSAPASCCSRALRRGGGLQPVRRHPVRPRPGLHRHHRPGALGQPQPGALPVAVRAGARLGARHLRPEHRQPGRHDLVGRADAAVPRRAEAHDAILAAIEQVLRDGPRSRDLGGSASTTEMGQAIAALVEVGDAADPATRRSAAQPELRRRPLARRRRGRRFPVSDPALDIDFASVPDSGAVDALAAVDAAHAAGPAWRALPASSAPSCSSAGTH